MEKDKTDGYSSEQYLKHEKSWYSIGNDSNDCEEVEEEVALQAMPVELDIDFANVTKGKGKGSQQSGQRNGWFNKMVILLCRRQRGEWEQVKLLSTAHLDFECNNKENVTSHCVLSDLFVLSGMPTMRGWAK